MGGILIHIAHRYRGEKRIQIYEEAYQISKRVIDNNFNDRYLLEIIGYSSFYTKRYSEAVEAFEKEIDCDQMNAQIWFELGIAYLYMGMRDKSDRAFRKAQVLNPQFYNPIKYIFKLNIANLKLDKERISLTLEMIKRLIRK